MNSMPQKQPGQAPKKKRIIAIIACVLVVALLIPTAIFLVPQIWDKSDAVGTTDVPDSGDPAEPEIVVNTYSRQETQKIEQKLISVEQENDRMNLVLETGSALESLETGDVFLLQGDAESAFGELYFGKVESMTEEDGKVVCKVVTPKMDEVFDSIEITDATTELGFDNISDFVTLDGVSISRIGSVTDTRGNTSSSMPLSSSSDITYSNVNGGIKVDFEVDILKLLKESGKIKTTSTEAERVTEADKAKIMTVYYTDTGSCYHRATCHCLAKSKHATDLDSAATDMRLRACQICDPPVLTYDDLGEKISTEASLTLKGSASLENLGLGILGGKGKEWSVKDGFENLSLKTYGNITANATLQGNFDLELSGTSTRQVLWGDEDDPSLYLDGLNEKLLPIAFFTWKGGAFSVRTGPTSDKVSGVFTIGVMIYTDLQGNVKAGTTLTCSYNRSLEYQMDIFRNGEFVALTDNGMADAENESNFDMSLKAEMQAEGDLQAFNASVMIYIGNVNVLEFALVKIGVEGNGTLAFDSTNWDDDNHGFTVEAKVTVYVELFDLAIKMKYNKWFGEWEHDPDPLCRWDIATFEVKTPASDDPTEPPASEPSTGEPSTSEPPTSELSPDDPDPEKVHIHAYGTDDRCESCGAAYEDIGLEFELKDAYYQIKKYSATVADVVIPSKYKGLPVTKIANYAFNGCGSLKTVIFSNTITHVGYNAFSSCGNLTKVTLGTGVTTIDGYAFYNCKNLSEINLPEGLMTIGGAAFQNCSRLKEIVIPNSVTTLNNSAFSGCVGLTSAVIGNSVATIGDSAFSGCTALTSLTIRESVNKIGSYAFTNCNALKNVTIPNSITHVGYNAFSSCGNLKKVTLGTGVTTIDGYAFYNCKNLVEINLPESLMTIGGAAFQNCSRLKEIVIPNSVTTLNNSAFSGCVGLTSVVIGNSVATIGGSAFSGCTALINLTIREGVNKIDSYAFTKCNALKNVTIPNSITHVGYNAFSSCGNLTKVTLGTGVTTIDGYAFYNCKNLVEINLPEGLMTIGGDAFLNCSALQTIILPDTVTDLGQSVFKSCIALRNVVIGEGVTTVGNSAFSGCTALTNLTIKEGVNKIDSYAFYQCNALKNVTIPNSVTHVGYNAFSSCGNLTKVTLGTGVTTIDGYAFFNCKNLVEVNLPEGLMTIGGYAFENCSSLQNIVIPNSITEIGSCAFSHCTKLTNIAFNGSIETWNTISKGSSWNYQVPATELACIGGSVSLS
ncbi:MAG: leucine-rich repeat domain-containing protein [Ruminococcaceae bacterium]|nr:leucine-rich repeat domain-containing protein [Oscillospiraceae bacterium]